MPKRSPFLHLLSAFLTAALLGWVGEVVFAVTTPDISDVRAAVVLKLPKYVQWKASAFQSKTCDFELMILGNDEVAKKIEELAGRARVGKRNVHVTVVSSDDVADITVEQLASVHMIYISSSAGSSWSALQEKCKGKPILTVSDAPGFASKQGCIELYLDAGKHAMTVNRGAIEGRGMRASSKLLMIAKKVIESE